MAVVMGLPNATEYCAKREGIEHLTDLNQSAITVIAM